MKALRRFPAGKIAVALALVFALVASARSATLDAEHQGWIISDGFSNGSNFVSYGDRNTFAGWGDYAESNNWFSFNLPLLNFSDARLWIWNYAANQNPSNTDPNAFYSLYEASSYTFAGLEAGPVLGSVTLASANDGTDHYVGIPLNAAGIAALNAKAGGQFNFGGSVTTSYAEPLTAWPLIGAFGFSQEGVPHPRAYLGYSGAPIEPPPPIPEPETYAMMLAGLGMLGCMARRRKRQRAA